MVAASAPPGEIGRRAPEFFLPGVDGRDWRLSDAVGPGGVVVMFICNHCPYVKAIVDRLVIDAATLAEAGIGSIAVMSNDFDRYPEDAFPRMREFAAIHRFGFPYVIDESQDVARAYGAVCTPDFFGLDADLRLRYRGRLDASRVAPAPNAPRDLVDAMRMVAATGRGPIEQFPSMGCSIKWRGDA